MQDGGGELTLPSSLLLVRNVGHLMTDASILNRDDRWCGHPGHRGNTPG